MPAPLSVVVSGAGPFEGVAVRAATGVRFSVPV